MEYPQQKLDPQWITGIVKIDDSIVKWLESFGKFLATSEGREIKPLTASQIRKFFGEVKKIQSDFERRKGEVIMLIPKLAYAVGRSYDNRLNRASTKIEEFHKEVTKGISVVNEDEERFNNLVKIIEGIVAFHRYHGGKI
jgi:CRISPR-associated protein Csm2